MDKQTKTMQLEIPVDLMEKIAVESARMSFHDRKVTVLSILTKYFDNKQ